MTSVQEAVENGRAFISERSHEERFSETGASEAAFAGSVNQDVPISTNGNESSKDQSVEIRIGTLSFDIQQNPTGAIQQPRPGEMVKAQEPHHTANDIRPQTQACRLSRHYLRGY
jgi:hypothetical protein